MKIVPNMNRIDQVIRLLLGMAMVWFGFLDHSLIEDPFYGLLLGLFGVLNIGSALMRTCPVYMLAGISTCGRHNKQASV